MKLKQLSLGGICTAQVYDFKRLEYTDKGSINLIFHNDATRTDQEAILTCYMERPVYIDEYYTPKSNVLITEPWEFINEEEQVNENTD